MTEELDKAVIGAANKDYKSFEKVVVAATEEKMKAHLTGFMSYLEKSQFSAAKEEK